MIFQRSDITPREGYELTTFREILNHGRLVQQEETTNSRKRRGNCVYSEVIQKPREKLVKAA